MTGKRLWEREMKHTPEEEAAKVASDKEFEKWVGNPYSLRKADYWVSNDPSAPYDSPHTNGAYRAWCYLKGIKFEA